MLACSSSAGSPQPGSARMSMKRTRSVALGSPQPESCQMSPKSAARWLKPGAPQAGRVRWSCPKARMFPQIFGKYVLERELASGGMARVYLATLRGAVGFEKRLVVKQIRPELSLDQAFVHRFVDEAKIAVELSHPNIVPVYELGVEQGIYYIAMELCQGLTLTEILMETGPLDAAEGAYVGVEICRALDYAHRRGGIVHRDVTPRNVLLDEEGAVRLIDFGIAAPVTGARALVPLEVFGSPGHMPPEQIRGERLTPATDVFAVGALLIEVWTGRPPFRRSSFEASAEALKEPLPSLETFRPELAPVADVIAQSVALAMADRPQEAEALGRKLRDFSRQFDSGDVAKRLGDRVRRARRRARSSSVPWLPGDSSGPLTPAASPRALMSSRPPLGSGSLDTPPMGHLASLASAEAAPITRTFAAREDLVEWTRKIKSAPPVALDAEPASASAPAPADEHSDEPATRAYSPSKAPKPARARPLWLVLSGAFGVAAVLLLTFGLGAGRLPSEPLVTAAPQATALTAVPVSLSLPAQTALPGNSGDVRSPRVAPLALAPKASASPTPGLQVAKSGGASASTASASSASASSGLLKLTADPPATVTVVGSRVSETHVTPVRSLKLAPGSYSVTFRSATFDAPVVTRVELAPGGSRSVHADFRAARPTVVVR